MQALARLSDFDQNKSVLFDSIGQAVVENIRNRWADGVGLEGKWRLSRRAMIKGDITLIDSSRLKDSMTHNVLPNGLEIGTDVKYGAIHHFGGEIKHEASTRRTYFRQDQRTGLVGNNVCTKVTF